MWGYVSERSRLTTTAVMLAYVGLEFELNVHFAVPLAYPPARFTANPRSVLGGEVTRSKPTVGRRTMPRAPHRPYHRQARRTRPFSIGCRQRRRPVRLEPDRQAQRQVVGVGTDPGLGAIRHIGDLEARVAADGQPRSDPV